MFILAHMSMVAPLVPVCAHAPPVSVNVLALRVPLFVMVTFVVASAPPGTSRVVVPPYLLFVTHVAVLLLPSVLPVGRLSVLRQVPPGPTSCMINVPVPAVLSVLVICAVKAENVGDIPSASTSDDTPPARTSGRESLRFFEEVSDMGMLTPWLSPGRPLGPGKWDVQARQNRQPPKSPRLGDAPGMPVMKR